MPIYQYEAVAAGGRKVKGSHRAVSKYVAITDLQAKGYLLRRIQEKKQTLLDKEINFGRAVKQQHFVLFCRQFATLMRSGVQVDEAVRILEGQRISKKLTEALVDVGDKLRNGTQLSKAMQEHPRIFPSMFVNMISAGEYGGNLDTVLERMAVHYEKEYKTVQKVKSAMMYPLVVLSISILVVIFLMVKIVPTFASMFEDQGAELPWITKAVMDLSESIKGFWWLYITIILGLILAINFFKASNSGKTLVDRYLYYFPIFGPLFKKTTVSRVVRTLSELMYSAVPVLQALSATEKVVENSLFRKALQNTRKSLEQGKLMSEPFQASGLFPNLVIHMMKVGEETGQVDTMLTRVADFIDEEIDHTVDRLKTTLEPIMLLFVSFIVGIIIASIMIPMFKLYETYL